MFLKKLLFGYFSLFLLSGCSGGKGEGNPFASSSNKVIPVSQIETNKLNDVIKTEPLYKIDQSDLDLLQKEGIITDSDKAKLQAIQ